MGAGSQKKPVMSRHVTLSPQQPPRKRLGGSRCSERGWSPPRPHPGEARRAEVALVWPEPLGEIVRRGGGVMSSRLGAVTATPGPTPFKQQRSTRIVGAKKTQCSIKDNSFQYTIPHDDSLSGSSSASSCEPVSDFPAPFRKSTYWMKMRRIKPAASSPVEGTGAKEKAKGKRKIKQEEDEDYRELPQKKHKLYGRKQRPKAQPHPKPQARRVRKEPPVYAAGSMEEKWYLEIMDKGSVSCPTCQAVGRKTIEGLKKHMENCKQPILKAGDEVDEPSERERLRTVLKRMGKLRVAPVPSPALWDICTMLENVAKRQQSGKLTLKCQHCGKNHTGQRLGCISHEVRARACLLPRISTAGLFEGDESGDKGWMEVEFSGIAVCHLQELASAELTKEWPKRKVLQDLVPDDQKEVLHKWKTDTKKYHRIQCPNQGCEAVYSSVSGLKAHLGSCNFVTGKYKCLLCQKEFVSESGVKYHINSVHA
ncbi:hypothetical protein U0070_019190, partial [Myodes glareolus]